MHRWSIDLYIYTGEDTSIGLYEAISKLHVCTYVYECVSIVVCIVVSNRQLNMFGRAADFNW